jgi:hypothetical protein
MLQGQPKINVRNGSIKGDAMAKQLNSGDLFPNYQVQTTEGRTVHLPQDLAGEYSVVIFYRGSW